MTEVSAARWPLRAAAHVCRFPAAARLDRSVVAAVGGHRGGPVQYRLPALLRLLPVALSGSRRCRAVVRRRPGAGFRRGRLLVEPGAGAESRRPHPHRAAQHGAAHRGRRPGVHRCDRVGLRLRVRLPRAHDPTAAHRRRVPRIPVRDGLLPVQGLPELRVRPGWDVPARGDARAPGAALRRAVDPARRGRVERVAVLVTPARLGDGWVGGARVRARAGPPGPSAHSSSARGRPPSGRRPRRVVRARRARGQRDHAVSVLARQGDRADRDAAVLPAVGPVPAGGCAVLGQRGGRARVRRDRGVPARRAGDPDGRVDPAGAVVERRPGRWWRSCCRSARSTT